MRFNFPAKWFYCLTLAFLVSLFLTSGVCAAPAPLDFDGDGKTDYLVVRYNLNTDNSRVWYILQSRDGFKVVNWGSGGANFGDNPVPADYDGDGKADIAVVRERSGGLSNEWYILNSRDETLTVVQWGLSGDKPMVQDYDGDGKADIAVYRNGFWYIRRSRDGQLYAERFGRAALAGTNNLNDEPLRGGDYDGDGKADLAVVRYTLPPILGQPFPSTLYLRLSRDGTWASYELGNAQFTGVLSGDYDGDGRADVAIWRGNEWLWIRSSDNKLDGTRFGLTSSDTPAPGDYDGDGKTDLAVYRRDFPQSGFYVLQNNREQFSIVQWGDSRTDLIVSMSNYIRAAGF